MCMGSIGLGMQAAGTIGGAYSSYRSSQLAQQGYEYQAAVARNNAQLAEWQAQDALARGQVAAANSSLKTRQLMGTQRAALAARGVALDEGSALNILTDTEFMGGRDLATIKTNADREAWAARTQSQDYTANASFLSTRASAQNPLFDAGATLLAGGGKVAQSWYSLKMKDYSGSSPWDGIMGASGRP